MAKLYSEYKEGGIRDAVFMGCRDKGVLGAIITINLFFPSTIFSLYLRVRPEACMDRIYCLTGRTAPKYILRFLSIPRSPPSWQTG